MKTFRVGILGATGTVGQRLISLLADHPLFRLTMLAASERSAGKLYRNAVGDRWRLSSDILESVSALPVFSATDLEAHVGQVDLVFSALDLAKDETQQLEEAYAARGIGVVSCNSAHRWTADVPMIIPEVNPHHLRLIEIQRRRRRWDRGFIVVKPNCSIQSYVPALAPLMEFEPTQLIVTTMQAISGAGKSLEEAPEILDNVIPLPGEESKSEQEPLKILGRIVGEEVAPAAIKISAHCHRVPAEDGHYAVVSVKFRNRPSPEDILNRWQTWLPEPQRLQLPSAPRPPLQYLEEDQRPQTRIDRNWQRGMGISVGRLRECPVLDYRFSALSHNTIRGAAGGAVLTAELIATKDYL